MATTLEQSIFKTLAYVAYFRFPLSPFEVWKWCDCKGASLLEVITALDRSLWLQNNGVRGFQGFWAIGDVDEMRRERIQRTTDALRKSRRVLWFTRFASLFPWVRMIAICNSLAYSFTNESSDIDLFVVTSPKRLWSTRLVLTGVLAALKLRPGEAARDPICLSFFVDTEHIDLAPVKIGTEDPYLQNWVATLAPVFDRDDILTTIRATNRWIRKALPRLHRVHRASAYSIAPRVSLPDFSFEGFAERIQRSRFPGSLRDIMNQDTRVVVTNGMLKFHENDRRKEILDAQKLLCDAAGL